MIQRIQSIYLFFVAILGICFIYIPYAEMPNLQLIFRLAGIYNIKTGAFLATSVYLLILNALIIILASFVLFLYKNRKLQIKLCNILISLIFIHLLLLLVELFIIPNSLKISEVPSLRVGFFIPCVAIICSFLARRGVVKDEALVRSADRIR